MIYVERVESTLKKGCSVTLGEKTVIVGPNGGGKSSIVQSIELAANGWASDMEGRARVKLPNALARLFPDGVKRYSMIRLSDGTEFSWELEDGAKDGSFKKPEHEAPLTVRWPVQDLMDVLRGDAATVGTWLEQQVVGELKESDILSALPPAVRDITRDFIRRQRKTDFIALAKEAKQEAKNLRSQATRSEKTIESMIEGIAPPLDDEARSELESRLAQMVAPKSGISKEDYDAARAVLEAMEEDIRRSAEALSKMPAMAANIGVAVQRVNVAQTILKAHVETFPMTECWTCGNAKNPDFIGQANKISTARSMLADKIKAVEERSTLEVEIGNLQVRLTAAKNNFANLRVAETVDDTARRAIMSQIASDDAARKTWANAEASKKEVDQLRSRADLLNLAGNALEKAGKQWLDRRKQDFVNEVNAFLPEGESLGVDLDSSRFGLIRNGELHSALSGAEWSRVLLALASAQEKGSSTPSVLVPEDRAWDPVTLERVMKALSNSPVQVIIMSTVAPSAIVEGWTCIDLT